MPAARRPRDASSPAWSRTRIAWCGSRGSTSRATRHAAPGSTTPPTSASARPGSSGCCSHSDHEPGVEPALAAREVESVQRHARGHARAAVRDDLARGHAPAAARSTARSARRGCGRGRGRPGSPRRASGTRGARRRRRPSRSARPARRARSCRPCAAATRTFRARPSPRPQRERPVPAGEVEHRARVVAVVAQQPPEPLRAAHRAVGDDVRVVVDARARHRLDEALGSTAADAAHRAPGGSASSASTSTNTAPGMCPSRYERRPKSGSSSPSERRRSGSARVTSEHAAAYQGHETVPARSDRRRRRARRDRGPRRCRPPGGCARRHRRSRRQRHHDRPRRHHGRPRRGDGHRRRPHAGRDRCRGALRRTRRG